MGSNFKTLPFLIIILIHVHFRTFGNFWKVFCHSRLSTANTRVCFHLSRITALCVCAWVFEKLGVLNGPTVFPASQGRRLAVTSHNLIQFVTKFCSLQPQISLRGNILSALLLSSFTWVFSFQTPSPLFIPNSTWPVSSNRKAERGSLLLETLPWLSFASVVKSSYLLPSFLSHLCPVPAPSHIPWNLQAWSHLCRCSFCLKYLPFLVGLENSSSSPSHLSPSTSSFREPPPFPIPPSPSLCCCFLGVPQPLAVCCHPGYSPDHVVQEWIRLFAPVNSLKELHLQYLEQCLAHRSCSVNICWINGLRDNVMRRIKERKGFSGRTPDFVIWFLHCCTWVALGKWHVWALWDYVVVVVFFGFYNRVVENASVR